MKRFLSFFGLAALVAVLVLPLGSVAAQAPSSQTYDVLVGYENPHQGIEVLSFFPGTVQIHQGDTVHWKINSNEIHTVTFDNYMVNDTLPEFLVPAPVPGPSPFIANPVAADPFIPLDGVYTGGLANSGIMGREEGTVQDFTLTFPNAGEYVYVCLVHGWVMYGTVIVKPLDESVPSPEQSMAQGNQEMAQALAQVPAVRKAAMDSILPPVDNGDGTMTYHVALGYGQGQISLLRFFPGKLAVRPGDTVIWDMTPNSDAPHTVTFLNGEAAPPLFDVVPPYVYIDPGTLFPDPSYPPTPVLTRSGFYSSGIILPGPAGPGGSFLSYSLTIGDMTPGPEPYLCLLHDESGMKGTLVVLPR
jgi:plastocyanin